MGNEKIQWEEMGNERKKVLLKSDYVLGAYFYNKIEVTFIIIRGNRSVWPDN